MTSQKVSDSVDERSDPVGLRNGAIWISGVAVLGSGSQLPGS